MARAGVGLTFPNASWGMSSLALKGPMIVTLTLTRSATRWKSLLPRLSAFLTRRRPASCRLENIERELSHGERT